jgi:hypothetical protein
MHLQPIQATGFLSEMVSGTGQVKRVKKKISRQKKIRDQLCSLQKIQTYTSVGWERDRLHNSVQRGHKERKKTQNKYE